MPSPDTYRDDPRGLEKAARRRPRASLPGPAAAGPAALLVARGGDRVALLARPRGRGVVPLEARETRIAEASRFSATFCQRPGSLGCRQRHGLALSAGDPHRQGSVPKSAARRPRAEAMDNAKAIYRQVRLLRRRPGRDAPVWRMWSVWSGEGRRRSLGPSRSLWNTRDKGRSPGGRRRWLEEGRRPSTGNSCRSSLARLRFDSFCSPLHVFV